MRTRGWLVVVAFSVLGFATSLCATTISSAPENAKASMLAPSNALAKPEVPTWTLASIAEQNAFTSAVLGDGGITGGVFEGAAFFEAAAVLPPGQTRSETRVPEPATLIFVGTGLIGIARMARTKKPQLKFGSVTARIQAAATQEV